MRNVGRLHICGIKYADKARNCQIFIFLKLETKSVSAFTKPFARERARTIRENEQAIGDGVGQYEKRFSLKKR